MNTLETGIDYSAGINRRKFFALIRPHKPTEDEQNLAVIDEALSKIRWPEHALCNPTRSDTLDLIPGVKLVRKGVAENEEVGLAKLIPSCGERLRAFFETAQEAYPMHRRTVWRFATHGALVAGVLLGATVSVTQGKAQASENPKPTIAATSEPLMPPIPPADSLRGNVAVRLFPEPDWLELTPTPAEPIGETLQTATAQPITDEEIIPEKEQNRDNILVPETPEKYRQTILDAAKKEKISPRFLSALLSVESMGFNPDVISGKIVSPAGALGIAQFMPKTAKSLGIDPLNPTQAIYGASKYLSDIREIVGDNLYIMAAGDNAGPFAVKDYQDGTNFTEKNPRKIKNDGNPIDLVETQRYRKLIKEKVDSEAEPKN